MLCNELERLLSTVFAQARSKRQAAVSAEHVLAALTEAKSLAQFWHTFHVDTQTLRFRLMQHIDQSIPLQSDDDRNDVQGTFEFHQLVQQAVLSVYSTDETALVRAQDVLRELCKIQASYASSLLHELGLTLVHVVDYFEASTLARGRVKRWPS